MQEPDPQQSISARQTEAITTTGSLENQELMPQGENLSVQRCAGSKCLPNRRKERENDREHGLSKLSRRPFKFNWVNENRVFGRYSCFVPSHLRRKFQASFLFPFSGFSGLGLLAKVLFR
jgi:hypothetical protein